MATEQGLYAQVVKIRRKDMKSITANENKMKLNSSSKVYLQYQRVDLILTLIGLK